MIEEKVEKFDIINELIFERAPWLRQKNPHIKYLYRYLKYVLRYAATLEISEKLAHKSAVEIFNWTRENIAKKLVVRGLHNVPLKGAALIVANHPTGMADAIFLHAALVKIRPDLYIFSNSDVLRVFPQLSNSIAPVEWREEKKTRAKSRCTLQFTKQAILEQRLGVIFPSGRLSKREGFKLVERDWKTSAVALAKKYDLPIIPIHISARNSILYYLFDMLHPTLRDITLFNEVLNKKNHCFAVNIGPKILPVQLSSDDNTATNYVYNLVIELGQKSKNHPLKALMRFRAVSRLSQYNV